MLRWFPFHVAREAPERDIRQQIRQLSLEAVRVLDDAGLDEKEILELSRQDLNELFPGLRNFKLRRKIAELIGSSKQESIKVSPERSDELVTRLRDLISRDDVKNSPVANAVLEDYLQILGDTEQLLASSLDLLRQHVKQLESLRPPPLPPPLPPPSLEHGSAFGAAVVGPLPHETCPGAVGRAHAATPVLVHLLVHGKTLGVHSELLRRLTVVTWEVDVEKCQVVLLFCPVSSRSGTDIDAALSTAPRNKNIVLVIMHYAHCPQQSLMRTTSSYLANICTVVHVFFHDAGLLSCEPNRLALADIDAAQKNYTGLK